MGSSKAVDSKEESKGGQEDPPERCGRDMFDELKATGRSLADIREELEAMQDDIYFQAFEASQGRQSHQAISKEHEETHKRLVREALEVLEVEEQLSNQGKQKVRVNRGDAAF